MVILCIQRTGRGFQCAPLLHLVDSNIITYLVSVESTPKLRVDDDGIIEWYQQVASNKPDVCLLLYYSL